MQKRIFIFLFFIISFFSMADDGSRLWLKYDLIKDQKQKLVYQKYTQFISLNTYHPILQKAAEELQSGFVGLLGSKTKIVENSKQTGGIVLEVSNNQSLTSNLAKDGFAIFSQKGNLIISSKSEAGVLYGAFELLRRLQIGQSLNENIASTTTSM